MNIKKSFLIAGAIACLSLMTSVATVVTLLARDAERYENYPDTWLSIGSTEISGDTLYFDQMDMTGINRPIDTDGGNLVNPPMRTNFLMIGLDNHLLTDALMAGTFYRDTGNIHLMSIPRDMYTEIPRHRKEQMRTDGIRMPSPVKINAVRAFGGRERGVNYLQAQLGEMLGVEFDYYIEVELSAFKKIVDAIGGVEMHIPHPMVYDDPYQNLSINIPAGTQLFDGAMAEHVVRFRSFPMGDLGRNHTHMEFMSQLIKQILTREALMNDPLTLANIVLTDVRTNVGLDFVRYLPYLGSINREGISAFVMPGTGQYIDGVSWFMPDTQALPNVINQVFYADV
ncbi:MAG: LCP family protein [Defluviitaleaceae bacterium]|nr:LCP family protein [Defluviitaleaceae bacterium]